MNEISNAITQFALRASIPLFELLDDDKCIYRHLGTATLFRSRNKLMLLFASHSLKECSDLERIAIPEAPRNSTLSTIGPYVATWPKYDEIDVAVVELNDETFCQKLMENWQVFDEENTADFSNDGEYFILGYPSKNVSKTERGMKGKPVPLFLHPSNGKPVNAKNAYKNVDIFFDMPASAGDLDPNAPGEFLGISGSAIWQIRELPKTEVWSASKCLKLVGIQSNTFPGDYIRGKQWKWVKGIIDQL